MNAFFSDQLYLHRMQYLNKECCYHTMSGGTRNGDVHMDFNFITKLTCNYQILTHHLNNNEIDIDSHKNSTDSPC